VCVSHIAGSLSLKRLEAHDAINITPSHEYCSYCLLIALFLRGHVDNDTRL
jgi:hypothetical protein